MYSVQWAKRVLSEFNFFHGTRTRKIIWDLYIKWLKSTYSTKQPQPTEEFYEWIDMQIVWILRNNNAATHYQQAWNWLKALIKGGPEDWALYADDFSNLYGTMLFRRWHPGDLFDNRG